MTQIFGTADLALWPLTPPAAGGTIMINSKRINIDSTKPGKAAVDAINASGAGVNAEIDLSGFAAGGVGRLVLGIAGDGPIVVGGNPDVLVALGLDKVREQMEAQQADQRAKFDAQVATHKAAMDRQAEIDKGLVLTPDQQAANDRAAAAGQPLPFPPQPRPLTRGPTILETQKPKLTPAQAAAAKMAAATGPITGTRNISGWPLTPPAPSGAITIDGKTVTIDGTAPAAAAVAAIGATGVEASINQRGYLVLGNCTIAGPPAVLAGLGLTAS